jgi:hypothetical protein
LDKPRKSIDLPWPAIAATLVALGGVFVYFNPLQTSRPTERTGLHVGFNYLQNVDARLWQDPLRTTAEHETQTQEQKGAGTDVSVESSLHAVENLCDKLSSLSSSDWVLAVMIPGGSYAEYSEARLRTRQAVLEALGAENYVPVDGEHIGYFKITRDEFSWFNMIIPFEWCDRSGNLAYAKRRPSRVCVVWLPEEEFRDAPFSRLDWLLRDPTALGIDTATLKACIIGPPTSATLSAMMHEVAEHEERRGCLPQVEMWCATATASDELLLHEIHQPEYQTIEKYFAKKMGAGENNKSFIFHRCTRTDRDVIQTLVNELRKKRGLKLNGQDDDDHIALISEWDTFYGRALPVSFEHAVSTKPLDQLDQLLKGDHPKNILVYHYLRGIDGMLPGTSVADAAKTEEKTKTDEKKKQSSLAREMTEGLNQADYLRRLARALVDQNEKFRRKGESEIKAVGVLGSDVYDKLLVMEALRDALPNAIFFTTSLDARLAHPDEWRWTRNLLVGSPFGLTLREKYQDVPPFRESSQTACYTATLLAAGNPARQKFLKNKDVLRPVRLYEIGRKGAFDLTPPSTSTNPKTLQPANFDMKRWWNLSRGISTLFIGLCAMGAIAWSVCVILKDPQASKGGEPGDSAFARVLGSPWSMFVIFGLCSVALVWAISCYNAREGEPYSWNDGISIWPTETLRLLAASLSVFYIWKISKALWRSEQEVESHFALPRYHKSLKKLPAEKGWCRRVLVRIKALWQSVRRVELLLNKGWWSRLIARVVVRWECGDKGTPIEAAHLWKRYCASGAQRARWLRIGLLVVFYIAAAYCLLFLLGFPAVPARGDWAQNWDRVFLLLAIFSSVTLTFYVADVMLLCRRFIHYLMKNVTTWPPAAVDKLRGRWSPSERAPVAAKGEIPPNELLREYLDIDFIAHGTDFVGRLIYYPFIVISLLIISRSGVFDHWTWPVALLIIVCFNAGYAAFSVIYLRRTAENARQRSLKRLHDMLMSYTAIGEGEGKEANTIREATLLIQNEDRGAFAAISQQPLARALLLPSGTAGIWALLQFFPRLLSG